uniref:Uncharacterized protein n=1 Tax=Acrobeloides nanus TaxID=290746 RepID=A0A914CHN5_9BILA
MLMHQYYYKMREIPEEALQLRSEVTTKSSTRIGHDRQFFITMASRETTLQSTINVVKRIWNALPADAVATSNSSSFKRIVQQKEIYVHLAKSVEAVRQKELDT